MQNFEWLLSTFDLYDLPFPVLCDLDLSQLARSVLSITFLQLLAFMEQSLYRPNKIAIYQRIFQVSSLSFEGAGGRFMVNIDLC